ncbi:MAG TPA: 30S ribosomal protein S20 [Terriglobia bacterium]|nr:30S ribosomal protein S20 [Terriglobia bacterium]
MANHKSALKRLVQTRAETERNRSHRTRLRHQIRQLRQALDAKDKAKADALLKPTLSLLDRMIQKGILHRNTAARYKSRLSLRFNALS